MTDQSTDQPVEGTSNSTSTESVRVESDGADTGGGGRDVEVPMDVYKAVTVFSTLIAVLFVVVGFVVLDEATQRATAAPEEVNIILGRAWHYRAWRRDLCLFHAVPCCGDGKP